MDEPKRSLRPSDLTPAQARTLRGLSKVPATKLTQTVKQLIELELVREFQSADQPIMYCRTARDGHASRGTNALHRGLKRAPHAPKVKHL